LSFRKNEKTNYESSKFENRVRNEDSIAPTLCARDYKDPKCVQIGTLDMKGIDQIKRVYDPSGLSPTLTSMSGGNTEPKISVCAAMRGRYNKDGQIQQSLEIQKNETTNAITTVSKDNLIIESSEMIVRKLTPRECWRLMSFTDEEFDRAAKVNSNSQLYKQARKFYCC